MEKRWRRCDILHVFRAWIFSGFMFSFLKNIQVKHFFNIYFTLSTNPLRCTCLLLFRDTGVLFLQYIWAKTDRQTDRQTYIDNIDIITSGMRPLVNSIYVRRSWTRALQFILHSIKDNRSSMILLHGLLKANERNAAKVDIIQHFLSNTRSSSVSLIVPVANNRGKCRSEK